MATKSSNTIGNPYHDESTGEFTSAGSEKSVNGNASSNVRLKPNVDLSKLFGSISAKPDVATTKTPKMEGDLKLKQQGNLSEMIARLNDLNQCANVPKLSSARDIENHIEEFFSKQVCDKVNEIYGKSTDCQSYQYRPKSNPHVVLELFPNILAKYRYKDNHAHYISQSEYVSLTNKRGYVQVFRGFTSVGSKARAIMDTYVNPDLNSFDLLCPAGSNCHGSNVYTSTSYRVASGYAGGRGTVVHGILDENGAYTLPENTLYTIMRQLDLSSITQKVEQKFIKNGVEPSRAARIANSFAKAASTDIGICAIMLGLDYFEAQDGQYQKNLLNVSRWYIRQ